MGPGHRALGDEMDAQFDHLGQCVWCIARGARMANEESNLGRPGSQATFHSNKELPRLVLAEAEAAATACSFSGDYEEPCGNKPRSIAHGLRPVV